MSCRSLFAQSSIDCCIKCTQKLAQSCAAEEDIFKMVLKADTDFKTAPWPSVSDAAKDCVRSLLNRDAKKRATASEILQHPWLAQQGVASDKPLDNVVIKRMRQVRERVSPQVLQQRLQVQQGLQEGFRADMHQVQRRAAACSTCPRHAEAADGTACPI